MTWNPFKDLPRGRDRQDRANAVLRESLRRAEEDERAGPEENKRKWNDQLRGMLDKSGDRGRLPDDFFDRGTDNPDDDGGNAA